MEKPGPALVGNDYSEPPELVFRWRRFRFPSFKFFVMLMGAVVIHLAGFYVFELAQRGETETIREEARLLILRSKDPESNRVLLAHFDALNAFEVAMTPRDIIDTGVKLAPSFIDYSLQPLPMPQDKDELVDVPFPAFTERGVINLAPLSGSSVMDKINSPPAADWLAPAEVAVCDLDGGVIIELPVTWDASFWSQNYGLSVVFDLGIDARGMVRMALGERAAPEVLQALRKELIGQRMPLEVDEPSGEVIIWKRCRIELW